MKFLPFVLSRLESVSVFECRALIKRVHGYFQINIII
jgi:hypothetical protein